MKTVALLNIFTGIGALVTLVSALWWGLVYHFVSQQNDESMWDSISCLYSLSESCNFLRGMGWLRGVNPYEPMLFWTGITVLLMSFLLRSSLGKKAHTTDA